MGVMVVWCQIPFWPNRLLPAEIRILQNLEKRTIEPLKLPILTILNRSKNSNSRKNYIHMYTFIVRSDLLRKTR